MATKLGNRQIERFKCTGCNKVIEGQPSHIHFDETTNTLKTWCEPCYDEMKWPKSARTFNEANTEAEQDFDKYHKQAIVDHLAADTFDAVVGGYSCDDRQYQCLGIGDLYMMDNPDGWVFFFEIQPDNVVNYVPYQAAFRAIELYILRGAHSVDHASRLFGLYKNFDIVDDRWADEHWSAK